MGGDYYWVRLKTEWPPKGWHIGKRETHQFDGNVYQWHLFIPNREYHVYSSCIDEVGPLIEPPAAAKGEK